MKPDKVLALEDTLQTIFSVYYPDVKVNIFKMEQDYVAMDVVTDRFKGAGIFEGFFELRDILEKEYPSFADSHILSLCPVSHEMFETRTGEDWEG